MDYHTLRQPAPQDLDFLVHELRFPRADTSVNKILSYLYNYLPYVKHEHNLRLIIASFLNNSTCFSPPPPYTSTYLIVEVFKLITDKKLKVSQPSLSVKSWYEIILKEITNFAYYTKENRWKVLPLIAGISLSSQLRDDLYTNVNIIEYKWFFLGWDSKIKDLFAECLPYAINKYQNDDIVNLGLCCLAAMHKKHYSTKVFTAGISSSLIILKIINLVFAEDCRIYRPLLAGNDDFVQQPVVKLLNRLSFLLETHLKSLAVGQQSFDLIEETLSKILHFNENLTQLIESSHLNRDPAVSTENQAIQQFWFAMKSLFFAEILIFQGTLSRFLTHSQGFLSIFKTLPRLEIEYKQHSFKILRSLLYMNFILLSIGQGGFDSFNFVYYLALEIVLKNNVDVQFENFTRYLIGNYREINLNAEQVNKNYMMRCKVLFVLGLWENYLQQDYRDEQFTQDDIFAVSMGLAKNSFIQDLDIIEAAHSVLLICFSKTVESQHQLIKALDYITLVIHQFPAILSPNQLSIAVEVLGKKILSAPATPIPGRNYISAHDKFLDFMLDSCAKTRSGQPIQSPRGKVFTSAQPIMEIDAASTLSQLDEDDSTDIIDRNKKKKPKDKLKVDLFQTGRPHQKYEFTKRVEPQTSREGLLVAVFNLVPYLPLSSFLFWLDKVWQLVLSSDPEEQKFLTERFWSILSENLDLNRSELAYNWWYQDKAAVDNLARL